MSALRRLRRRAKGLLAILAGRVLGSRFLAGRRQPPLPAREVRSVLVIRIDERVGNILLTTPLFVRLRDSLPAARVEVLVAASKARLLDGIVTGVPFDRKAAFRRPAAFLRLLGALRRRRYDLVIDASHWHHFSLGSAALLAWTAGRQRVAHDRGPAGLFATHLVPMPDREEPEVVTKLRLLEPLGIPPGVPRMVTAAGTTEAARAATLRWRETLGPRPVLGLAPGSRKLDHRAPLELFAGLGRHALGRGMAVAVLWGPGEDALAAALLEQVPGAALAPPTGLEELAAAMRACAAVVANDTGPMHLAVACEVPTLALFRNAPSGRWGHRGDRCAVIEVDEDLDGRLAEAREALDRILAPAAGALTVDSRAGSDVR